MDSDTQAGKKRRKGLVKIQFPDAAYGYLELLADRATELEGPKVTPTEIVRRLTLEKIRQTEQAAA